MKVILTQDVRGQGKRGQMIEVAERGWAYSEGEYDKNIQIADLNMILTAAAFACAAMALSASGLKSKRKDQNSLTHR